MEPGETRGQRQGLQRIVSRVQHFQGRTIAFQHQPLQFAEAQVQRLQGVHAGG